MAIEVIAHGAQGIEFATQRALAQPVTYAEKDPGEKRSDADATKAGERVETGKALTAHGKLGDAQ